MTVMWEVRAAEGRLDELVEFARAHADPSAQIYTSIGGEPRLVVIDPTGRGLEGVPDDLVARPAHVWRFAPVERT